MQDVVIIGGGVAGLSLAALLAPAATVTVLEAESALGYHASGRSAALYEPRYGAAPVVELSLASGEGLRAAGVLSPRGMMMLAGANARALFEEDAALMQLKPLSVEEASVIVPILNRETVAFAALADHAWDIDTDRLLQSFARDARAAGAQILTGGRVARITRQGAGWRVETGLRVIEARVLVNAGGAWADAVAQMAGVAPLGLQPHRRSMARIPAPGGRDLRAWPMLMGAGETWYAKPDAGALIVSPAEEDPMPAQDAFADDMVLAEGLARYEAMVTEPVTRMLSNWAGLRTFSRDRVPVIGFDVAHPSFFWLAGQGGYGFQSCFGAAELARDLLLGRPPAADTALVAALSPERFDA